MTTAPPPAGRNMTVRTTAELHNDLSVLTQHGATVADVVREAVRHMADAYRRAHDYGDIPADQAPRITHAGYAGEPCPHGRTVGGSAT